MRVVVAPTDNEGGRDPRGRFAPGNPGGPGGSRRRAFELRRVGEDAITPEIFSSIMRRAARMALEGNLGAIRFVAERVAGRAADVPLEAEPAGVTLPKLETARDCARATDLVLDGVCKGAIDRDTGRLLLDGIALRLKAVETVDIEQRLRDLEQSAAIVDLPGRRRP